MRFLPDWLFWGGRFRSDWELTVCDDGRIVSAGAPSGPDGAIRFPGRALLPGLVNAHSHAFQRLIRGRTELASASAVRPDFWSWRDAMYQAANALSPEELYVVSRQAFLEMALSGITAVGEFHYLHHQPDGAPYQDRNELAKQVVRAARDVGLRIALLRVGYQRAGHQLPANPQQRRFIDSDVFSFLRAADDLRFALRADPLVSVGLAPHSVRAVSRPWLEQLSKLEEVPVHMHVAEQPAEVAACLAEHHWRPVELLEEVRLLSHRFTAVHAIHISPSELDALGQAGAKVCACPSTERNLGDSIIRADEFSDVGVALCLGSDSQASVDLLDECRQLEGHLRLFRERRAIFEPAHLLEMATRGGAKSLGLSTGELTPGTPADFFTVDLNHPSVVGATESDLLSTIVFSAGKGAIRDVCVAGRLIVRDGIHPLTEESSRAYRAVASRVFKSTTKT